MRKKKIIYLSLIIILLILCLIIIFWKWRLKRNYNFKATPPTYIQIPDGINVETNHTEYFTVKDIISSIILHSTNIYNIENNIQDEAESEYTKEFEQERLKSIFSYYINKENINDEDFAKLYNNYARENYEILEMYVYGATDNIKLILVDGAFTKSNRKYPIIFVCDESNYTVLPYEYISKVIGNREILENLKLFSITSIEHNGLNKLQYSHVSEQDIARSYFNHYKKIVKEEPEKAYDYLETNYKNKKFGDIDSFNDYLDNLKNKISNIVLKAYKVQYEDDYTRYVCLDNNNHYYIFNVDAVYHYSVILDTYTVDLPEFLEKYENSDSKVKTALNIQKIVDALNDGDYKYVYGKLADEFKGNYFNSLERFTQYAKNTFGNDLEVEYKSFVETSNYCTYDIIIKNKDNQIKKTIIMKLEPLTEFVFSFNVD